jgi:hypothetical protein
MHGGAKDFSREARYNAIKRFLNEKLKQIGKWRISSKIFIK